mgnify:FL=1
MKIMINGIQSNLRFSSAHVIPGHESCGYIHGHSYFVDVEIEGERAGDFEFVVDFKDVKAYTKAICNELDHRLLIPVYNDLIDIKDFNKKSDSIFDLKEEKTLVINDRNPLIKKVLSLRDDETKKEAVDVICNQIVDLALLANKELSADELDLFIKRSNELMSRVISL